MEDHSDERKPDAGAQADPDAPGTASAPPGSGGPQEQAGTAELERMQELADDELLRAMAEEAQGELPDAAGQPAAARASIRMPDGPAEVKPARFDVLSPGEPTQTGGSNIELLLDVNLPVSIELGRTQMSIAEILELGAGSIVELDKLAGEPVDILVNNRPLAKGEVVVLDENFGVRITNLVSPRERLERLQMP